MKSKKMICINFDICPSKDSCLHAKEHFLSNVCDYKCSECEGIPGGRIGICEESIGEIR